MPFLTRPDGATIYYEVKGAGGVPVLLISPGGMGSSIEKWDMMPFNPWKQLPTDQFTLIGMDQRYQVSYVYYISQPPITTVCNGRSKFPLVYHTIAY
mmetsp:Transcript_4381/g.5523  ORF Transcript_4381/g.5523 Transcript_4381/m.5523 type:complete len:97 (+) Transcript_4381:158-448(+)